MKKSSIAFFILIPCLHCLGQTGSIKGIVRNYYENTSMGLTTIYFLKGDSVIDGTVVYTDGDYKMNSLKAGTYDLWVILNGYRGSLIKDVKIEANITKEFNIIYPDTSFHVKRICPKGHTDNIIPIFYGLIIPSRKLNRLLKKEKIRSGGCIVTGYDPVWYCKTHEIEFPAPLPPSNGLPLMPSQVPSRWK